MFIYMSISGSGGARGPYPTPPVKIRHKKMATEGRRIDFMFLSCAPLPLTRPLDPLLMSECVCFINSIPVNSAEFTELHLYKQPTNQSISFTEIPNISLW